MRSINNLDTNKVLKQILHTRKGKQVSGYQVLKENFYEICKRRDLKLDEIALAIYLRGKSCRYGNPFKLSNELLYKELNTTRRVADKVKIRLQLKGLIKFNSFKGAGYFTEYTMLDTVMIPKYKKFDKARQEVSFL